MNQDPTPSAAGQDRRAALPVRWRVLVADDHPFSRAVIALQLRHLGCGATLVEDGLHALAALERDRYDLLISDCHMPRLDGPAPARRIRAGESPGTARLPIHQPAARTGHGTPAPHPGHAMTDPYNSSPRRTAASPLNDSMVTTAPELPGYRIVRNLGLVRGITVRSRSIVGNFFGGLQTLFGGNITIYTELCEQARDETYRDMFQHARQLGANAIIAVRYDATDVMAGLSEVLCYGTAVVVEPLGE